MQQAVLKFRVLKRVDALAAADQAKLHPLPEVPSGCKDKVPVVISDRDLIKFT